MMKLTMLSLSVFMVGSSAFASLPSGSSVQTQDPQMNSNSPLAATKTPPCPYVAARLAREQKIHAKGDAPKTVTASSKAQD